MIKFFGLLKYETVLSILTTTTRGYNVSEMPACMPDIRIVG